MAIRYSGNAEVRLSYKKDRYVVRLRHPGGIVLYGDVSRQAAGVTRKQDPRSSESYDRVAEYVFTDAKRRMAKQFGVKAQLTERGGHIVVDRVFQSPCPIV